MSDKVVFRKTPGSRWCVRAYKRKSGRYEAYASHSRCTRDIKKDSVYGTLAKEEWSWLIGDIPDPSKGDNKARCHECGAFVPADILTIVRLHEGQ